MKVYIVICAEWHAGKFGDEDYDSWNLAVCTTKKLAKKCMKYMIEKDAEYRAEHKPRLNELRKIKETRELTSDEFLELDKLEYGLEYFEKQYWIEKYDVVSEMNDFLKGEEND